MTNSNKEKPETSKTEVADRSDSFSDQDENSGEESRFPTGVELGFNMSPEDAEQDGLSHEIHSNPNWSEWDGGIVGGEPSWLLPLGETDENFLKCPACNKELSFLLQIYAPNDEIPDAFHRSLYVFICRNIDNTCIRSSKGIKVLRAQTSKVNKYYPAVGKGNSNNTWEPVRNSNMQLGEKFSTKFFLEVEPEEFSEEELKQIQETESTTGHSASMEEKCALCGECKQKLFRCGRCRSVSYCNREHQKKHWKVHRATCELLQESSKMTESEHLEDLKVDQNELDNIAAGANQTVAKALNNKDETFLLFQKRIKHYEDQVIRFTPLLKPATDVTGPVWISEKGKVDKIPRCSSCGGTRKFELQIMPQLLHELGETELDWGIICIYTCENSCSNKTESNYLHEYCWVQNCSGDDWKELMAEKPKN